MKFISNEFRNYFITGFNIKVSVMSKDPSKPQHFSKTKPNHNRPREIWLIWVVFK